MSSQPTLPENNDERIDYSETPDLTQRHAAIERENLEPTSGTLPLPVWLLGLSAVVLLSAGYYVGLFGGGFNSEIYTESTVPGQAAQAGAKAAQGGTAAAPTAEDPVAMGKKVYEQNCVSCHQPTGMGLAGAFPPLGKSEYVKGSPKRLAMILLKGIQGPIKVEGVTYNGAMPSWERALTDKKLAAVATYIRQSWGNTAGPMTPDQFSAARKEFAARTEPWTEADLLAVPAEADLAPAK